MGTEGGRLNPRPGSLGSQQLWSPKPRALDIFGLLPLLSPHPLSSHLLVALGAVTWHCRALLTVVQKLISTHSEMMRPVGLEAKHCYSLQPGPHLPGGRRELAPGAARVLGTQSFPLAYGAQLSGPEQMTAH